MRRILAYVGLAIAVATVTAAVRLSYQVTTHGQAMSGAIVAFEGAALELTDAQEASDSVTVDRVVAPDDS